MNSSHHIAPNPTVVGIDVGGAHKGFHAVALRDRRFVDQITATDPTVIVAWCREHSAIVVAVDAPCEWSQAGLSRLTERELALLGKKINCFATPTRKNAENHTKGFYDWVFNGKRLYTHLRKNYPLFKGDPEKKPTCIETFPHAIVCAMAGRVIPAKPKAKVRRTALQDRGYDDRSLPNIDFVDAALCAVAANEFRMGNHQLFGNPQEGFIVVPTCRSNASPLESLKTT
jgi:predicted nuclease with RNAse H fold